MSRLEHDVERDLRQIAERATPSPDAWSSILTRIADQELDTETEIIMLTEAAPTPTRRWPRIAAAAAVVVLVVAGIALFRRDDSPSEPTDSPTSTEAPFAFDDALSVADNFFERYNAGDATGVLALFASDATFSDWWGGSPEPGGEYTPEEFEMLLVWEVAQGDQLIDRICAKPAPPASVEIGTGSTDDRVTLVCELGDDSVLTQATDRDPVPITLTFVISADGIHEWNRVIGHPNFVECCQDFRNWVIRYHPDEYDAIDGGTSVVEARQSGELRARLADEWVAHTTPSSTSSSSRVCKSPCSATQPDESTDPPATTQP